MKFFLEYILLRAISSFCRILPYRIALFIGWIVALISFAFLRNKRKEAIRRISLIYNGAYKLQARKIAWISWRNICFNVIEIARFPLFKNNGGACGCCASVNKKIKKIYKIDDLDLIEPIKNNGFVFGVIHMGNWDFAGVAMSMLGYPVFVIARRQKNKLVDDYLNKMRSIVGLEAIYTDDNAMRQTVRYLKDGKSLAILPDIRGKIDDIAVNFLGLNIKLSSGMALFAKMSNVPIAPVIILRQGWARHYMRILEPIYPDNALDRKEDCERMTCLFIKLFDKIVKEHPEQYFWYNKKWLVDG